MGIENPVPNTSTDTVPSNVHAPDKTDTLTKLQSAAGLHDPIGGCAGPSDSVKSAGDAEAKVGSIGDIAAALKAEPSPPSDAERANAEKSLESGVSKLIPEADRASIKAMTTAITNGDSKAFAEAVKSAGGDPAKLKELVNEVNKSLDGKQCPTRLDVTGDGKVLVGDTSKSTALAFDPKTGNVEAKSVEYNPDGSVLVRPGELLHVNTDQIFSDIGNRAADAINGKAGFSSPNRLGPDGDGIGLDPHGDFHIPPLFPGPNDGGKVDPLHQPPVSPGPIEGGTGPTGGRPPEFYPQPMIGHVDGPGFKSLKEYGQYLKDHGYKPIEM